MGVGVGEPVAAPLAVPPRVGLLASVRALAEQDERWGGGFKYLPEGCAISGAGEPCNRATLKTIPSGRPLIEYEPFYVWAGDRCSGLDFSVRDWQGRARRLLEACQSWQIEREFWSGVRAKAAAWPNRYLASPDSDVVTAGPATPLAALACLEEALGEGGCGARGMIHAQRDVVTYWDSQNLLRREAGLTLTVHDTIVVAGGGYPGTGPDGQARVAGSAWAYATGMVDVRLSDIDFYGGPNAEGVIRESNDILILAERVAAATWDNCVHAAAEINILLCGLAGS